jgi:hypothetical protein
MLVGRSACPRARVRLHLRQACSFQSAAIAQPVEHIIRNDGVGGSNPSCGTSKIKYLSRKIHSRKILCPFTVRSSAADVDGG